MVPLLGKVTGVSSLKDSGEISVYWESWYLTQPKPLPSPLCGYIFLQSPFHTCHTVTQRLIPSALNDVYIITIEFKSATPNTSQTHLDLWFENGGGLLENLNVSLGYYKGNNTTQTFHNTFQYYVDQSFIDSGANIKIQSHGNSATVWDIQYFIQKTQSYA